MREVQDRCKGVCPVDSLKIIRQGSDRRPGHQATMLVGFVMAECLIPPQNIAEIHQESVIRADLRSTSSIRWVLPRAPRSHGIVEPLLVTGQDVACARHDRNVAAEEECINEGTGRELDTDPGSEGLVTDEANELFVEVENKGCCFEGRGGLYEGDSYGVDVDNQEADRVVGMGWERVARTQDGGPVSKEVGI